MGHCGLQSHVCISCVVHALSVCTNHPASAPAHVMQPQQQLLPPAPWTTYHSPTPSPPSPESCYQTTSNPCCPLQAVPAELLGCMARSSPHDNILPQPHHLKSRAPGKVLTTGKARTVRQHAAQYAAGPSDAQLAAAQAVPCPRPVNHHVCTAACPPLAPHPTQIGNYGQHAGEFDFVPRRELVGRGHPPELSRRTLSSAPPHDERAH